MNKEIFIRYIGKEEDNSIIPFCELGESLIGFDASLKQISKILRFECEIELKAKSTRDGSLIVDALVGFSGSTLDFFSNIDNYLEFAKLCGKESFNIAVEYFNSFENIKANLNDYFAQKPIDLTAVIGCLTYLFQKLGEIGKKSKTETEEKLIQELKEEIPERILKELFSMLKSKNISKVIKPISEDVVKSIEIDTDRDFQNPIKIDHNNFHDYLTKEDQILPEFENGNTYELNGEITSIKSTRGESMTFQIHINKKEFNLDLFPAEGYNTKAYTDFYKEDVHIEAEVIRISKYKKPKLKLLSIELNQKKLGLVL